MGLVSHIEYGAPCAYEVRAKSEEALLPVEAQPDVKQLAVAL